MTISLTSKTTATVKKKIFQYTVDEVKFQRVFHSSVQRKTNIYFTYKITEFAILFNLMF